MKVYFSILLLSVFKINTMNQFKDSSIEQRLAVIKQLCHQTCEIAFIDEVGKITGNEDLIDRIPLNFINEFGNNFVCTIDNKSFALMLKPDISNK